MYRTVTDTIEVRKYLDRQSVVAFDIETAPLEPYRMVERAALDPHKSQIVGISFSVAEGSGIYVPLAHRRADNAHAVEMWTLLAAFAADPNVIKVAHNLSFESMFFYAQGIVLQPPLYDTIAAAQLTLKSNTAFRALSDSGLKTLVPGLIGDDLPTFEQVTGGRHFDHLDPTDTETVRYACADSDYLDHINPVTGRIHPDLLPLATETGRFASRNPNMQNMPRAGGDSIGVRKFITAPDGKVLLSLDFSQIELRVGAFYCRDEKMLETYRTGGDIHAQTTMVIYHIPFEQAADKNAEGYKERRTIAKNCNFGVFFGLFPNDKRTQAWAVQLNNAKAELNGMEHELDDNNKALERAANGFDDAERQADDFGNQVEDSANQTDDAGSRFDKLGGILKGVGVAMGAVAVAAAAAAIKLGKEVVQQFGELEQNLGGSEAVFGQYAASIQKTGEDGLTDAAYFRAVFNEAVELCAYLCKQYGLNETHIICHSEGYKKGIASNHGDVLHWWPKHGENMDTFRAAVKKALAGDVPTAPATPTTPVIRPTLRRGGTGADVLFMQQRLCAHGFTVLMDGAFGPDTEDKIRKFQTARQLAVDGVCGPNTWAALEAAPSVMAREECRAIIQNKCQFSDPAAVWGAIETHRYADDLYQKLASVMK